MAHSYNLRPRNPNYQYPTDEFDENDLSNVPVSNDSPILNQIHHSETNSHEQTNQQQDQYQIQNQTLTSQYRAEQLSSQMSAIQNTFDSQLTELSATQQNFINQEQFISQLNNLASYQQSEANQQLLKLNNSLCQNEDLKTILQNIVNFSSTTTRKLIDALLVTNNKVNQINSSLGNSFQAISNFTKNSFPNAINQLNLQYSDNFKFLQKIMNILPQNNNNSDLESKIYKIEDQLCVLKNQQIELTKALKEQNLQFKTSSDALNTEILQIENKDNLFSHAIELRINSSANISKQFEDSIKEKLLKVTSLEKNTVDIQDTLETGFQELMQKVNKLELDQKDFKVSLQNFDPKQSQNNITALNNDIQQKLSNTTDSIYEMAASITLIIDSIKKQNASFNQKLISLENDSINYKYDKLNLGFANFQKKISEQIQQLSNSIAKKNFNYQEEKKKLQINKIRKKRKRSKKGWKSNNRIKQRNKRMKQK